MQPLQVHPLNVGRITPEARFLRRLENHETGGPDERLILLQQRDDLVLGHVLGDMGEQQRIEPVRLMVGGAAEVLWRERVEAARPGHADAVFIGIDADATSGRFGVYASIEFAPKAGGARQKHEEVGLYTVKNDIVTREEFYYDGPFIGSD